MVPSNGLWKTSGIKRSDNLQSLRLRVMLSKSCLQETIVCQLRALINTNHLSWKAHGIQSISYNWVRNVYSSIKRAVLVVTELLIQKQLRHMSRNTNGRLIHYASKRIKSADGFVKLSSRSRFSRKVSILCDSMLLTSSPRACIFLISLVAS